MSCHRFNQPSGNATTEVLIGQHSEYWPLHLYLDHTSSLQDANEAVELGNSDAESSATTHSSNGSITNGIGEQARLLEGIQGMETYIVAAKHDAALLATSFVPAPFGANVESSTQANWTITKENYHKLLKTLYTRNEDIKSCRDTIKGLNTLSNNTDVKIRHLEARIERHRPWKRIYRAWRRIFERAPSTKTMHARKRKIA
ncbi:hypothetical protein V491_03700 [Pseudogymnoascus sp. VKM F-3775]|nr:hypothetical protein V491_03700 [Pseudogymnoascus sp. VKM F-3775]